MLLEVNIVVMLVGRGPRDQNRAWVGGPGVGGLWGADSVWFLALSASYIGAFSF